MRMSLRDVSRRTGIHQMALRTLLLERGIEHEFVSRMFLLTPEAEQVLVAAYREKHAVHDRKPKDEAVLN
jgi:hypothetical protein